MKSSHKYFSSGHGFGVCVMPPVFRQGTASAVPYVLQNECGFSR